jgi:hypothetical protein
MIPEGWPIKDACLDKPHMWDSAQCISGKRIPELDDDMLADEDDAAAVEIERAAASVKQSRMRHEIKMVPVAGEGEELRPLLSDLIPEVIGVRCSYSSTSIEQLASVALAFGQDLETHRDPRLRVVERAQLRGHRADRIEPPLACLVRTQNARLVTLAALAPEW